MITIYRTPPAHQNPVQQGNNSAFPYRARVLVSRQMDGSSGTMIEAPFAQLFGRRVEVAFELLKSGIDIAFWFGDEVELLPAEEMPESGVADETGG